MPRINAAVAEKARKNDEALPAGDYYLRKDTYEASPEKARTKTGRYMPSIAWVVTEPAEFKGRKIFQRDYFVLGTEEDPDVEHEDTVGPGLGKLKRLAEAAGVPWEGDIEDIMDEIETVGAYLVRKIEPAEIKDRDSGEMVPNEYAGRIRVEVKSYFKIGEREPKVIDEDGPTAGSGKLARPKPSVKTPGFGRKTVAA